MGERKIKDEGEGEGEGEGYGEVMEREAAKEGYFERKKDEGIKSAIAPPRESVRCDVEEKVFPQRRTISLTFYAQASRDARRSRGV